MTTTTDLTRLKRTRLLKTALTAAAKHTILLAIAAVMIGPLFWMATSALKTVKQTMAYPPEFIPNPVVWKNFADAWNSAPFGLFLLNSLKVAVLTTFGQLLVASLAAYAFARLNFKGKGIVFGALLATMMIPYTVRVIPLFVMLRTLGWVNTHYSLIMPPVMSNVFGVFLLRQFFMSLPYELDEAALIDGSGFFGIWWRILMPLSKPALATLGLFAFRTAWNQFLPVLIFIRDTAKTTITVGLTVFQGEFTIQWHLMMAASVFAVLPILIIYVTAQKYFVRGIVLTGIKG
jgi:multiple sugar transport system permease protein